MTSPVTVPCFHIVENGGSRQLIESYLTEAAALKAAKEINARCGEKAVWVTPGRYWAEHFGL
jgi:hypothetical protein